MLPVGGSVDDCPDPRSSTIEVEKSLFLLLLLLLRAISRMTGGSQ